MNNSERKQEEEEKCTGESAMTANSTAAVGSSTVAPIPLPLSAAQLLAQDGLQTIFAFLTLGELAAVSGSCRFWRSDVASGKGCESLELAVDEQINERLFNLSRSPLRHYVGYIGLDAESVNASVQLMESLPLLSTLPSLTHATLSIDATEQVLTAAKVIAASDLPLLPLTLLHLKVRIEGSLATSTELMQQFLHAAGRLSALQTLELADDRNLQSSATASLDFSPLMHLAPSLMELKLNLCASAPSLRALCSTLQQMSALKSICIYTSNLAPRIEDAITLMLTSLHQLQQLERLIFDSVQIDDAQLKLLMDAPALKHIAIRGLQLNSLDSVVMLLDQMWSLEVDGVSLNLNASLTEDQADGLLSLFPQLFTLQLFDTPLSSLRCLRLVTDLTTFWLVRSSQRLHAEDIEYIYALKQLRTLRIVESEPILLTVDAKAALQVRSKRLPKLNKFHQQ